MTLIEYLITLFFGITTIGLMLYIGFIFSAQDYVTLLTSGFFSLLVLSIIIKDTIRYADEN